MKVKISFSTALKGKAKFWVFSLLFTGIGCVFVFLLPHIIMKPGMDTVYTRGKVISVLESNGMYCTTVEFTTADGKAVKSRSNTSSGYRRDTGSEADIVYNISTPGEFAFTDDMYILILVFKIIGWIILLIGGTVLLLSVASLYVTLKSPQNEGAFFWWINFTGGLTGALAFILPSAFIYPLFSFLPQTVRQQARHTSLLLPIFTVTGILVAFAVFFIARNQYRGRPRWKKE